MTERGQTLPDFAIAIAVFLLAVVFLVAFIPQVTAPYEGQEHVVVADRIAGSLADGVLSDEQSLAGLDERCTVAFFLGDPESECDPSAALSTVDRYAISVQLVTPGGDPVCGDDGSIVSCERAEATPLTFGMDPPTDRGSVNTAHRTLHVNGSDVRLDVTVWEP